jgi:hypothetical protein
MNIRTPLWSIVKPNILLLRQLQCRNLSIFFLFHPSSHPIIQISSKIRVP